MTIAQNVTSGELLYRLCDLETLDLLGGGERKKSNGQSLQDMLDVKAADANSQLEALQQLRQRIDETHAAAKTHIQGSVMKRIDILRQLLADQLRNEADHIKQQLTLKQKAFDAQALKSVLSYTSIMRDDMRSSKSQLEQERRDKEALKKQAKVCRDLLIFAHHLQLESRSTLSLTCLPPSSPQYVRCVKAVHDNLSAQQIEGAELSSSRVAADSVRVLNVFKVKNAYLSKALQMASSKSPQAKVKGLFCSLPVEHVHAFVAQGVDMQFLPLSPSLLQQLLPASPLPPFDEVFSSPWVSLSSTHNTPAASPLLPLLPLPPDLSPLPAALISPGLCERKGVGAPLRFGRFSVLSTLPGLREGAGDDRGVFLSLCRVVIVRQMTVDGDIGEEEVVAALRGGFDAIYSTASDEYVLLNAAHVLPEFLIHTDFLGLRTDATAASNGKKTVAASVADGGGMISVVASSSGSLGVDSPHSLLLQNEVNFLRKGSSGSVHRVAAMGNRQNVDESIRLKQMSLQAIEQGIEGFRQEKNALLMQTVERLRGSLRAGDLL
eukprot:gene28288-34156_t